MLLGCSKPSDSELAKQVLAQTGLSDEETIQKLAEIYFDEDVVSTKKLKDGSIELSVVTHPNKTAETKQYGTGKATDSHKYSVLLPVILNTRGILQQADKIKLGRITIKVRDTAHDENRQLVDFDLFGFTVVGAQFTPFLHGTQAQNLMRNDPRDKLRPVCKIDFDNFDQLTFSNKH